MKFIPLSAAVAALSLAACSNESELPQDDLADTTTMPEQDAMAGADPAAMMPTIAAEYVAAAGASDLYEIESSRMALEKSENAEIREFAQMMIDNHTSTTEQLTTAAEAAGMTPGAPAMMPMQQQMIDELTPLTGADFDRTYLEQQRRAHQMALNLHQNYAASGDTEELREVASSAVPIIEGHIEGLQGLSADSSAGSM